MGAAADFPEVVIVDGRTVFRIALGWLDAERHSCECSICARRPGARPGWVLYEQDVECVWLAGAGGRRERKRSGDAGRPAA